MKLFFDCHEELSIQNFSVVCWDNIDNIWRVNFIYYVEYIFKQTEVILMIKIPFLWKELPASGSFGKTHKRIFRIWSFFFQVHLNSMLFLSFWYKEEFMSYFINVCKKSLIAFYVKSCIPDALLHGLLYDEHKLSDTWTM